MLLYIWLVTVVMAVWLLCRQKKLRFSSCGVNIHSSPNALVSSIRFIMMKKHFIVETDEAYKKFYNDRFIGRLEFFLPMVHVKDIELIKKITVKDFEHFIDHRTFVNEKSDPLFGRNLFSLRGHEWKDMRSTLSPAFTSSKIRLMLPFMVDVGKQMKESLIKKVQLSKENHIDVDIKDLTTRFANDVIASCAFGLNVNSHRDENNQFYIMGKQAISFGGLATVFKTLFYLILPEFIASKFNLSFFSEAVKSFFRNMVMDTMKDREARNIVRPDMIHLLMEAKKGQLVHEDKSNDADAGFATVEESVVGKKLVDRTWSDDDLVAQALLFFIAGFETVSSAMSFTLHELAINPDIQERLVQEIKETDARTGGKFDYAVIQNMTYMDMVVSEALRLWPPAPSLDRVCVKDYNLGKANDDPKAKDYYIHAGEGLQILVYSIHRDPENFPDPLKFDPERFSDENKHNIKPFTYMPFGTGPRNCIGSRFALCELKVMLYQLLLQMEVMPNEKTCIPAKLDPKTFNFHLYGGHWLRFKLRN